MFWIGKGGPIVEQCILLEPVTGLMSRAGFTGTDVNRALTSYEVMHTPFCNWMDLACSTKCCVFPDMERRNLLPKDQRMLANSFSYSIHDGAPSRYYESKEGGWFRDFW